MNHEVALHDEGWVEALRHGIHRAFGTSQFGPTVDVIDEEDSVRVVAELPGLSAEDFKAEIQGDSLVLRGEKRSEHQERRNGTSFSECSYGSFYRAIPLPAGLKTDQAEATYANGVLELVLPKSEEAKARTITVKVK